MYVRPNDIDNTLLYSRIWIETNQPGQGKAKKTFRIARGIESNPILSLTIVV